MVSNAPLRVVSCISEKADYVGQAISAYIADRLCIAVDFVYNTPWQERERQLDCGEAQVGWICGLSYARKIAQQIPLELLVAPVMVGRWYQNRPVYYSDIVVHTDSAFQCFADLRGASWAYNEPSSFSGYFIVRHHLAMLREVTGYFRQVIASGAHSKSLQMVVNRQVDATAIDSTTLDLELRANPTLSNQIRTIEMLGPNAIPPLVIAKSVDVNLRSALRTLLLTMHHDTFGRLVLRDAHLSRFSTVPEQTYISMGQIIAQAELATL